MGDCRACGAFGEAAGLDGGMVAVAGCGRDGWSGRMSFDENGAGQLPVGGTPPRKAFRRDREHKKLLGVCAGIAEYFDLDVVLVRIGWAVATILGCGSMVLIYIAIALIAD